MYILMVVIFVLGYAAIALEHNIKVDKAASALLTGVLVWTVFVLNADSVLGIDYGNTIDQILSSGDGIVRWFREYLAGLGPDAGTTPEVVNHFVVHELEHHLIEISEILFFLLGAMTIVELIDAHEGFAVITDRIKTTKKAPLLWILATLTFFFSAALDNLTTAIVMSALLKKLINDKKDLWLFAGVIIIAANAGGAWSPIGDVTTIMLWIGQQVTASNIIMKLIIPSIVCLVVPMLYLTFTLKGNVVRPEANTDLEHIKNPTTHFERNLVFGLGVACLLFVPVFKTITHLPPFMGILLGLGIMWVVTEILHGSKNREEKNHLSVIGVLSKVDVPSVLFFLGILVAVAALQSAGHLVEMAKYLQTAVGDIYVINIIIGLLSSIVDNVPLVAGAMGMYEIGPEVAGVSYPQDHTFWEFLAYCAGTGGSCLIIGSAAGVAVMGILKIDFMWYLKRISFLALMGYLAGAACYFLMYS
jgi:Na+/H+ antiporter NhaD/arsenite permease-like protein